MAIEYPKSEDNKIQLLTDVMVADLYRKGIGFSIEDSELSPDEVMGFFGCLSLFILEAKDNYEKVYNANFSVEDLASGYTDVERIPYLEKDKYTMIEGATSKRFPVEFRDNEEAYFNAEPFIEDSEQTVPFVIMIHFLHYTVDEYIQYYLKNESLLVNGKVPVDALRKKWENAVRSNKIEIKPKKPSSALTDKQKN